MRATLFFVVASILFSAEAAADDSINAIREAFQRNEKAIEGIRCSYISLTQPRDIDGDRGFRVAVPKRKATMTWALTAEGDGTVEAGTESIDARGTTSIEQIQLKLNEGAQTVTHLVNGEEKMRNALVGHRRVLVEAISPFDMTIRLSGLVLSEFLSNATVSETEEWEGRPVLVIDVSTERAKGGTQTLLWVDVERGIAVKRLIVVNPVYRPNVSLNEEQVGGDYAEIAPGVWFPNRFQRTTYSIDDAGRRYVTSWEDISVTDWAVVD